jgi:superfamily II DNA/RNA helicase
MLPAIQRANRIRSMTRAARVFHNSSAFVNAWLLKPANRFWATTEETLQRLIDGDVARAVPAAALAFVDGSTTDKTEDLGLEDDSAEEAIDEDDDATAEAASLVGAADASNIDLSAELAAVDGMLARAEEAARKPDARVHWLVNWIKANLLAGRNWNGRRLIIFTEWEDTRRWLEKRLKEALADTDRADERIDVFTGATGQHRREEVKRAFNADPAKEPLRILICTDAAREGINLQTYCSELVHFDLPWNPSRLEQRNGRIDRKLQPAPQVFCRYFRYEQRDADIVLDALVRKTAIIRDQLGSAGQVIEKRIADRLAEGGIDRGAAAALAKAIEEETDAERLTRARSEMDDDEKARYARLLEDEQDLQKALETHAPRSASTPTTCSGSRAPHSHAPAWRSPPPRARPSAARQPSSSIPITQLSPRRPAGRIRSTTCASARASAASGSTNGGARHRSAPSPSSRRDSPMAAMRRRSCRSISSTGWSAGCSRASSLRASRPGCRGFR